MSSALASGEISKSTTTCKSYVVAGHTGNLSRLAAIEQFSAGHTICSRLGAAEQLLVVEPSGLYVSVDGMAIGSRVPARG